MLSDCSDCSDCSVSVSLPVTFSTSWYLLKSKYPADTYLEWMDNLLSNVYEYNLVIYSDEYSCPPLHKYLANPRIRLVIKPLEKFHNYRYADSWQTNHAKNSLLNPYIDWRVNMLWCEKVHFVEETMRNQYFVTDFYGWIDIGYFRASAEDLPMDVLARWPSVSKIQALDKTKVYYALVNGPEDSASIQKLRHIILDKNAAGLPRSPIPANQYSVAGGFFILYKEKLNWWRDTFDARIRLYFENEYLIKDDQIIVVDCIFSNRDHFVLSTEPNWDYDKWFMFQRLLL